MSDEVSNLTYLASTEGYKLEVPRACQRLREVVLQNGVHGRLLRISPPLIYVDSERGQLDLNEVVVVPRHVGYSVRNITTWPFHVHVLWLVEPQIRADCVLPSTAFQSIAWAALYPTKADALADIAGQLHAAEYPWPSMS